MVEKEFEELNNDYSKIQSSLEIAATPHSALNQLLQRVMEKSKININENDILKQANKDLATIRNFYCKRFYSASMSEKSDILARYQNLYDILINVSKGNLTLEHAAKMIKVTASNWESGIIWNNVLRICFAITCVIPLIAGVMILPFVLPVISLNLLLGATILTAASSSIILGLSQSYNNLSDIQSTEPVRKNSRIELSFLNNMNKTSPYLQGEAPFDTSKSRLSAREEEDADDYEASHQTPAYH